MINQENGGSKTLIVVKIKYKYQRYGHKKHNQRGFAETC